MARGTQLQDVVEMVMRETKATSNAAAANDYRQTVKELIRGYHEDLAQDWEWPFLKLQKGDAKKTLAAGQRYYDFPANLDTDQDFRVFYQHNTTWIELVEGIGPDDYNSFDSDLDERAEPALKWAYYGESQFEIWPLPSANTQQVWFSGRKKVSNLANDTDTLSLDDRFIALYVAADMLEDKNKKSSERKRQRATERYMKQRANTNVELDIRLGVANEAWPPPQSQSGWPRIIAVYNAP